MRIGIPREIKSGEHRVAASPSGVASLTRAGHEVLVEAGAGEGSSMPDQAYVDAGATIVDTAEEVWAKGDLLLKVKEPIGPEFGLMRPDQILFTYLHLAAAPECAQALLDAGTTSVATLPSLYHSFCTLLVTSFAIFSCSSLWKKIADRYCEPVSGPCLLNCVASCMR